MLAVYTLFGKNKIKFGQNFFASPKICTPVHLWMSPSKARENEVEKTPTTNDIVYSGHLQDSNMNAKGQTWNENMSSDMVQRSESELTA